MEPLSEKSSMLSEEQDSIPRHTGLGARQAAAHTIVFLLLLIVMVGMSMPRGGDEELVWWAVALGSWVMLVSTWGQGMIRFVLSFAACILLPMLATPLIGLAVLKLDSILLDEVPSKVFTFLHFATIGVGWFIIKHLIVNNSLPATNSETLSRVRVRSPLLTGVTVVFCILAVMQCIGFVIAASGARDSIPSYLLGLREIVDGPGVFFFIPTSFTAFFLVKLLWQGRSWAMHVAWPFGLLAVSFGGPFGLLTFLLLVCALCDVQTDALCGSGLSEATLTRLRRRTLRPLTGVAWVLVAIAAVVLCNRLYWLAEGLSSGELDISFVWHINRAVLILSVGAMALAFWEHRSLSRAGHAELTRSARVAIVVSGFTLLAELAAPLVVRWLMSNG